MGGTQTTVKRMENNVTQYGHVLGTGGNGRPG